MAASAESLSPRRIKLRPPRLPEDVIARPRLVARLNRMAALSLVVAPAGYGKTTLVGTWLAQTDVPFAWLSLDETDNDPALFLAALATGLATIFPRFGGDILEALNSPHVSTFADLTVLLINELNELSRAFILVLDDYHVIHEPLIHQLLIDLVTYPPRAMHLVLTTRHDPPLPWRVRTRSSLCELRAADLSFTDEEAAQFFANFSAHPIGGVDTTALITQSQGWITSLRLTALAMRIHGGDARWHDMVNAGFRDFDDYFSTELLAGLAPRTLSFLLRTSILDPLCGPLCDYVISGTSGVTEPSGAPAEDSASVLRTLEHMGAFTAALDDEGIWYRYHPLLREMLRRKLEVETPKSEITGLYGRAAEWLEDHGHQDEALAYALGGGEISRAVAFLQRHRNQLLDNFEWRRLERWLQQFPPAAIERHVELLLTRASINQWRYNLADVQADLNRVEVMLACVAQDEPQLGEWRGEIAALRSQQYVVLGDAASAVAAAQLALANLPARQFYTRTLAVLQLVLACQMAGQWERASGIIDASVGQEGVPRDLALARMLTLRAYINLPAANLTEIRVDCPTLLQAVTARALKTAAAWAHYFWATACYQQNDLHGAAEHFSAVLELVDHAHALAYAHSAIGLAMTYHAQGLPQEARGVVEGAMRAVASRQQTYALAPISAFAAELAAHQGGVAEALRWVAREGRQFEHNAMPMFYVPGLAFVRILLAGGTAENLRAAATWLERQMGHAVQLHNTYAQIQCYLLAAVVHNTQGERPKAISALRQALALAEHGQVVRAFVDLANELMPLCDSLAACQPLSEFSARVHSALKIETQLSTAAKPSLAEVMTQLVPAHEDGDDGSVPDTPPGGRDVDKRDLRELLTYREMDVLMHLEQRLTNKEIAHVLGISTETVRQHTVNLFRKMNVSNRRQAIVAARSRGYFG